MNDELDYFFRYLNNELTEQEKEEEKLLALKNANRKMTNNPYASCGMYEDELELSLDTH